jgi:hypothetical protein
MSISLEKMPSSVPPMAEVPVINDYLVLVFSFLLLIGLVFFPLTSAAQYYITHETLTSSRWAAAIFLTPIFCCASATVALVCLMARWRGHYRWLIDRTLSLGLMCSLAGFTCNVFIQYCGFIYYPEQNSPWDLMGLVGAALSGVYVFGFAIGIAIASRRLRQVNSRTTAWRKLEAMNAPQAPQVEKVAVLNEVRPPG